MQVRFKGTPEDWLAWLTSGEEVLMREATFALGGISPSDGFVPDHFQEALSSPNERIVFWSIVALGRLERGSLPAIPKLVEISAQHRAFGVRQAAVQAISKIAPESVQAKQAIFSAFEDASEFVRREALQAVIAIPKLNAADINVIRQMSDDPDRDVSRWSEIALRNIQLRGGDA